MPKISIITVNLNNSEGLRRTLDSIEAQSFQDFQFIVVDGDSTDQSKQLIANRDAIIDLQISESDTGVYNAMNKGIALATGDYLLFLNSGDHFIDANSLQDAIVALVDADLVCFDISVSGQGKDYIKQHPDTISLGYMLKDTLAHQATFIKRSLFDTIGFYDESLKIAADWKFFIEVLLRSDAKYKAVHHILTQYYLDGMSATAKGTFTRRAEREVILQGPLKILATAKEEHLLLQTNRFKILRALESSKVAQKLNSAWLRMLLLITKGKSVNDL